MIQDASSVIKKIVNLKKIFEAGGCIMKEILFFDGAMGSELHKHGIKGCPELTNVEKPEIVIEINKAYIEAGADFVSTNTFGANRYKLAKYGVENMQSEIIKAAIDCARKAISMANISTNESANESAKKGNNKNVRIALDMGPTGKLMQPYGDASFQEIYDVYAEIAKSSEGADVVIFETFSQLGEMRAAFLAFSENTDLPIICSMTFEANGKTLTGTDPAAFAATMEAMGAYAVGVNCSLGPDKLADIVARISSHVSIPVIAMPNAGIPRLVAGKTIFDMKKDAFSEGMDKLVSNGAVIIGGCCGTTPEYIKEMNNRKEIYLSVATSEEVMNAGNNDSENNMSEAKKSRLIKKPLLVCSSGKIHYLEDEITIVGERINPTGRKILSENFKNGDYSLAYRDAISQTEAGANLLDINVAVPGTNEINTMKELIMNIESMVNTPLQIDSSNPAVLEAGLRQYNGIAMVNSVNGKDENLASVLPLVKKYGACVIGLTMGKDIPKTAEGRFEIAEKIRTEAEKFGINKDRLFIDCLSMAASATQDYTAETLRALTLCKESGLHTALGVSNVSFGLPERKILNAGFLAMALGRNLNLAIINPLEERMMEAVISARVIFNFDKGCSAYIQYATDKIEADKIKAASSIKSPNMLNPSTTSNTSNPLTASNTTIEAKAKLDNNSKTGGIINSPISETMTLEKAIIKGLKKDALDCLNIVIEEEGPFGVVDKYIIPSLQIVGENFETGKIYLPQLLQSAETVKALFEKIKTLVDINTGKGIVVLCTVQGDIHDIGKNIVKVMLQNNGYEVVDLGCDVDPEKVLEAVKNTDTKLVGLSALMTTTIPGMEATIEILKGSGVKVVVGGAVLSQETADRIGADFYAKDAVETVRIADRELAAKVLEKDIAKQQELIYS